jgi:hypothetical protein
MNANDLFKSVMQLDLDPIKTKLMHVASGEGWSLEKANAVEKEYRRFLCLMKLFPNESTAPLVDVDTFWHYHILDTMKYAVDCEQVFGYFLHHDPHVGMDGTHEDEQFRLDSGKRMGELYESLFGEAYPASITATAYCASPGHSPASQAADIAYCASPGHSPANKASSIAYCASPGHSPANKASSIAYCASPGHSPANQASGIAYCASPGHSPAIKASSIAYCASPGHSPAIKASSIAYCASPGHSPAIKASGIAYCASPGHSPARHTVQGRNRQPASIN